MKIKTGYSFRTATGDVEKVVQIIKGMGWEKAPIADRASTFGWVPWTEACEAAGIEPVYGVELAVTENLGAKKPVVDYWTFYAIDDIADVNRLVAEATRQFRYEPLLSYEQAMSAKGVYTIVGNRARLDLLTPSFIKRSSVAVGWTPAGAVGYYREAAKRGLRPIASPENRYPEAGDEALYEIICGRGAGRQTYPQYIVSDATWRDSVPPISGWVPTKALNLRTLWLNGSKAQLRKAELFEPKKPKTLRKMCEEGAKKLGCDLKDPVYKARLDRELKLIADKNFEDYFYIIADLCQWARKKMLVGPARGSSCGSLVCYLLRITTIDPIPYGLIFERFIDVNRSDLPDIDIDFNDQRRHLVFEYMAEQYGADHVARLGAVAKYQPRSSLSEAGAALSIPKFLTDKVLQSLIERSSGDSRALSKLEDTLKETPNGRELLSKHPEILIAGDMEGHPRHYSQHAAGVILTKRPVMDYVALDLAKGSVHCDKYDAEVLGLLKIDALGLRQLAVLEDTLVALSKPREWLEQLPTDDKAAFDVLNEQRWAGIFQFTGSALMSLTRAIHVGELNDIISITALARPGPMASGGSNRWVARHEGKEKITYPHKIFEPYLRDTLGVVVYQEQVMEIGRNIGDLNWEQVTALRKAMSKSLGKEYFDKFGDPFKKAAIAKGVPAKDAEKIWDDLCAYGSWAFNKSHSVAYGLLSYYCCYLKAHHPLEFAAATLTHEPDADSQLNLLRELHTEGIDYIPVDPIHSDTEKWISYNGKLLGPISNIVGVGPKALEQVRENRKPRSDKGKKARGSDGDLFSNMSDALKKKLQNPKTKLDNLWPIDFRIKEITGGDLSTRNITTTPTRMIEVQANGEEQKNVMVIGVVDKIALRDDNDAQKVANRGGTKLKGPSMALNMWMKDDSGDLLCRIQRWDFERLAPSVIDRGRPGKAIYAIKGEVPKDFRMIAVKQIKYMGDMEETEVKEGASDGQDN